MLMSGVQSVLRKGTEASTKLSQRQHGSRFLSRAMGQAEAASARSCDTGVILLRLSVFVRVLIPLSCLYTSEIGLR